MEVVTKKRMMIFSGSAYPELAREVCDHLGMRLGELKRSQFANGELYARPSESVRGADVFVIQSHVSETGGLSINDHLMEQLLLVDAMKRASAKRIVAVAPYYAYSRSDKKTLPREHIGARLVADMFEAAGADRVMSVDPHTGQIQGFFRHPMDHLTALPLLETWIKDNTAPDERVHGVAGRRPGAADREVRQQPPLPDRDPAQAPRPLQAQPQREPGGHR